MNTENIPEICLYGTPKSGFGFIAAVNIRHFGDGVPNLTWSATNAVALACLQLHVAGFSGPVFVYSPGGEFRALTTIESPRYYGDLTFHPAPVLTISADEIIAAADETDHYLINGETALGDDVYGGE